MKVRIISSIVALAVLAVGLYYYDTMILNVFVMALSIIATFELLKATKLLKYSGIALLALMFSCVLPFAQTPPVRQYMPLVILVIAVSFFICVLKYHSRLPYENIAMGLVFSLFVPLFLSSAVYTRNEFGYTIGVYYLLLAFGSAWFSDTCAYFAGRAFGKHKLAPVISPKKTVEGAIGGLIGASVCNAGLAFLFTMVMKQVGRPIEINYLIVLLTTPFLAGLGVIGDLSASVIKRQYNVKDYGKIMPGHGGVMDRFDSALLTLPAVYVLAKLITIAK